MNRMNFAFVSLLTLAAPRAAFAQDTLATAKRLYEAAAYEEALVALDRLRSRPSSFAEAQAIAQYRAYALLALSRQAEAEAAIEETVKADLFFMPSATDVSPRVRAAFQNVRRRLLPASAQAEYARAKATFDRKEFAAAAGEFERVARLLHDPQLEGVTGIADLRVLAVGFRDLARAAVPPPSLPPEVEASEPPPASVHDPSKIYDLNEPGIIPPVTERQEIPPFPGRITEDLSRRRAVLELVIGESGRVDKVSLRPRIDPRYDALLLEAATTWRYTPARTKDGTPVKFAKRLQITIR
ncbi:MAG: hypothetical protein HY654_11220 [Acidobacteria bacterium]|nr:hypothetical protein [Acidobacteriota bacterium]